MLHNKIYIILMDYMNFIDCDKYLLFYFLNRTYNVLKSVHLSKGLFASTYSEDRLNIKRAKFIDALIGGFNTEVQSPISGI